MRLDYDSNTALGMKRRTGTGNKTLEAELFSEANHASARPKVQKLRFIYR